MAENTKKNDPARQATAARLKSARERAGMAVEAVAEALSLSKQAIYHWELGQHGLRKHRFVQLAQLYGVSASWLQFGVEGDAAGGAKSQPGPVGALFLSVGPGGAVVPSVTLDEVQRFWALSAGAGLRDRYASHFPCSKASVAIIMPDQSMAPLVERGDLLVVDPNEMPRPGDLVLCIIAGGGPEIRKYRLLPGGQMEMIFYHEDWPTVVADASDVEIIGVVTEYTKPRRY